MNTPGETAAASGAAAAEAAVGEIARVRRVAEVVRAARRAARGVEPHSVWGQREADALSALGVVSAFLDHHAHTDVARMFVTTLLTGLTSGAPCSLPHHPGDPDDLGVLRDSAGAADSATTAGVTGAAGAAVSGSDVVSEAGPRRRRGEPRRVIAHDGDVPLALWPLANSANSDDPDGSASAVAREEVEPQGVVGSRSSQGRVDPESGTESGTKSAGARDGDKVTAAVCAQPPTMGAVRVWAQAQGYAVGLRGRLSRQVRDAYLRAHPELTDPDRGGPGQD